jgi:hypothetical protein
LPALQPANGLAIHGRLKLVPFKLQSRKNPPDSGLNGAANGEVVSREVAELRCRRPLCGRQARFARKARSYSEIAGTLSERVRRKAMAAARFKAIDTNRE